MSSKENFFEVKCKTCGQTCEAKDAIISADFAGTEWDVTYKYVTLKCPFCKKEETFDKTDVM